jgi:Xaa-Pro aminopeptidase
MRIAPSDVLHGRFVAVATALASRNLDALLITALPNIAYLTGFFASAAAAIVTPDRITLIGDGRYADALSQRGRECPFLDVHQLRASTSYDQAVVERLLALGPSRFGFEAAHLTVSRYNFIAGALEAAGLVARLEPAHSVVEHQRATKDEWELTLMREAAGRLSEVAKCILPNVLAGRVESEIAADIDRELRRVGFQKPAFDTIVASGANAARPHARAGERRIEPGDLVVLDFGGVLDGYCTDITRTVTVGPQGQRERRVIEAVAEAQLAAFDAIRPGGAPEDVDRAAREVLGRHGMGEAFSHGTGHGLGLEVHELPRVGPRREPLEPPLAAGMVLTLEPGAYFPGWGGVRIEDDVVVTASGAEWLTNGQRVR